jgi:signal transduction histidine kinase
MTAVGVVESGRSCHAEQVSTTADAKAPKAYRIRDRALVAGVAAGVAAHFRFPVWVIRAGFIAASAWKLSGAVAYAVLWLLLARQPAAAPIGLVAAERQGLRTVARRPRWPQVAGWVATLAAGLGIGYLIRWYDHSPLGPYAVDAFLLGWGIGLLWLTREVGWPRVGKVAAGSFGILCAWVAMTDIVAIFLIDVDVDLSGDNGKYLAGLVGTGATILACLGAALPWIVRPAPSQERAQAELIAQTRADMAAHLHDSVLQTLAVIQKQAGDPKAVSQLARRQERELREWLYEEQLDDESSTAALKQVVAEVEATWPVAVELVTVGEAELTVELDAVVRAAREAAVNAAKHSGADQIDMYAEISSARAEVFVRDRGRGFQIDDIGEDRMGIRGSIIDRMARYGGTVDVRSTPGEGTQIHLTMPLDQKGATGG